MSKRKIRRLWAFLLSIALIMTSITMPDTKAAASEITPPAENMKDTAILSVSGGKLTSNDSSHDSKDDSGSYKYDGYIQTVSSSDLTGDYFKVTYKAADGVTLSESDKIFTFQPFDTGWGGWQDNIIKVSDSQLDSDTGEYTAWISIADIKASYTSGGTLNGVNISFCQKEPAVILTGLYMSKIRTQADIDKEEQEKKDKEEEAKVTIASTDGDHNDGHETLQEIKLSDITKVNSGLTFSKVKSAKVTVYIHVTKDSSYSRLKIRGGNLTDNDGKGSFSNKELIGKKCTTNAGLNNPYAVHAGYRTSGGYGSGMGVAESSNYKFYDTAVSKVPKGVTATDDTQGIRLTRMTTDVEAYIIGIVFGSVGSVSVAKDGTITKGFDPSKIKLESTSFDDSDLTDAEYEEAYKDQLEAEKAERKKARDGLKAAIDACNSFSENDYEETSLAKVKAAIPAAEQVYANENSKKSVYREARDKLESVRAKLVPKMTSDAGNPKSFRILNKKEVISEMGAGINLGNTMDGGLSNPSETSWQAYKTTKAYIKALHDAGYNTVRVPVTWNGYINADYSIKEEWIKRVQEIVDYCVEQDMYCIINIHHDGAANHDKRGNNPACWLNTAADDIEAVYSKFAGTWKTIAERFKDYDEHLIFESMNEVTDAHDGTANEDTDILNNLNQIFVNAVRATGSNNTKRWLGFTGRFATFNIGLTMPDDPLVSSEASTTRLMFAVHIYKDSGNVSWTLTNLKTWQSSLSSTVGNVNKLSKDIPIYVGEYGVRQKSQSGSETGMNNTERALNSEFVNYTCRFYGVCPVVWDQGDGNYVTTKTNTGLYNYWNRPALEPVYADTIEGMMRGTYISRTGSLSDEYNALYKSYGHSSTSDTSVSKNPAITEITDISLQTSDNKKIEQKLSMKAGEYQQLTMNVSPESTNDIVLWSTDDDAIATVSNGKIHAKGTGVTTVHTYSQSKSFEKDIKVVVSPSGNETATAIKTKKAYYEIKEGGQAQIETELTPENSKDEVTYTSSNTDVATVNSNGIISAETAGVTYVVVTAASGVSTIVKVKVVEEAKNSVNVALNVLIGAATETGPEVSLTGDGQYTVTYDIDKNLSEDGKKAGITQLKSMTAVYIRDCNKLKQVVQSAKIRYDKVVVNDTELTITKTDFKDALKTNGQLDTNDPINGWDGNAVEEAVTDSKTHTVDFKGIENPTKISITFTIKDMKFYPKNEKTNEASKMEVSGENKVSFVETGETKEIETILTPADTDSFVTFYSADSAVAAIDNKAQKVDENGKVKMNVTAVGDGKTVVTAITENGQKAFFAIGVGNDITLEEPADPTPDGLDGSTAEPTPTPEIEVTAEPTKTPDSTVTTEPTKTPDSTATTEPTKTPDNTVTTEPTKTPDSTATTEPTKTPDSTATTEPTKVPDIQETEEPEQTAKPDATEEPNEPELKTQTIKVVKTITKSIGSKKFNLKASASGEAELEYQTSNRKVVTVDSKGNVTVKGYGTAVVTVKASETDEYSEASAKVTINIVPKAVKLSSVKSYKGGKIKISWKKDKTVSGYVIQYSSDSKFKKNVRKITITKCKTTSKMTASLKKQLKAGKGYVRICAYKTVSKKKLYGAYSGTKSFKLKK